MSEDSEKPFCIERAKQGRAACKKCKEKCLQGELRIAKIVPSPYGEGKMKSWHHIDCLFEAFLKQRATTKRLQESNDLDGWDALTPDDQEEIAKKVEECEKNIAIKTGTTFTPHTFISVAVAKPEVSSASSNQEVEKDCLFREFRRLIAEITNVSSYLEKTALVNKLFTNGAKNDGFKGDITLWCKLLLPGVVKRIYNLQSKQLIKLFCRLFGTDQNDMLEHLEQGDIGETIQHFHEISAKCKPAKKSNLTLQEVDDFLEELSKLTKEDEQVQHFKLFAPKCTTNDLKLIIRLIKHDLRMNAGAKHILDGVHPNAYESYQASRDLKLVIERCCGGKSIKTITLLTPVLPMLAEPCKSIQQALKKCPNGMYSEIKYDGERVQVHKSGTEFRYYSRSLKPVMQHKIRHFKDYIPQAFPHGKDLILDSEILMVDTETGMPLPFGTLGKHKKEGLENASVCLYVFDCIYYNGQDLTTKPLKERKQILQDNMKEIPSHIVFSEMNEIHNPQDLAKMITKTIKLGLEGLVLKDLHSIYEPGKRHWLKVKKDYLFGGAQADSADLIVLGAWYGTGKKGGIMSVFLMGVHDASTQKFYTVTKVHTGHDDKTLEKLQDELEMIKISKEIDRVPSWLKCTKSMVPDFVAKNPKKQPVWEITGAEFTKIHDVHTADGISIRFPRVTRIRDDKNWETATSLQELKVLFDNSKENFDGSLFDKELEDLGTKYTAKRKIDAPSTSGSPPKKKCEVKLKTVQIKDPLPDLFEGIRLKLEPEQIKSDHSQVLRLFVAYSGIILTQDFDGATHVLHNVKCAKYNRNCPRTAFHITTKWLEDCIFSNRILQLDNKYMVYLIPDEFPDEQEFHVDCNDVTDDI